MTQPTKPDPVRVATGLPEAFRIHGVPVFAHWSLLLVDVGIASYVYLVSSFLSARPDWRVAIGCCWIYTVSITAHELGHAAAAAIAGLKVHSIHLSGGFSYCRTELPRSVGSAFLLFSAGLLGHLMLLMVTGGYIFLFGWPRALPGQCVVYALTLCNLTMLVVTLVPYRWKGRNSDGLVLWQLLMHVLRDAPYPWHVAKSASRVFPPNISLLAKTGMKPAGFETGLEILNDDKTPMDFVVRTLQKNFKIDQASAITVMLKIHNNGGLLLPTQNIEEAQRIARGIAEDCRNNGQSLICRAVADQ